MRYICLLIILIAASCQSDSPTPTAESLLTSTTDYLWSQQAADGGWHSSTHGILKGGKAWTPFVLFQLMQTPGAAHHQEDIDRAIAFIRSTIGPRGAVGIADSLVLEYPNYATSYAYRVLRQYNHPQDSTLLRKMRTYLLGQQFAANRGFEKTHPVYGGWGFGEIGLQHGAHGHVDLSHTRRVLQALTHDLPAQSAQDAQVYLSLLQKLPSDSRPLPPGQATSDEQIFDGGFYASTTVYATNKAGTKGADEQAYFESYATTTCDGILALIAAGVGSDDPRIVAAAKWLTSHPDLEKPEGIPVNAVGDWEKVLFYYHLSVRAEAYQALDWPGLWRDEILNLLAANQRDDGSFANPWGAPNKEDDPLLASAMAVGVLAAIIR